MLSGTEPYALDLTLQLCLPLARSTVCFTFGGSWLQDPPGTSPIVTGRAALVLWAPKDACPHLLVPSVLSWGCNVPCEIDDLEIHVGEGLLLLLTLPLTVNVHQIPC